MTEETTGQHAPAHDVAAHDADAVQTEAQTELQAEQESAAAMDADVPQPPDESHEGESA
jgi:hypothetical protein